MQHAFAERPELQPTRAEWITGIGTPLATQFRSYVEDEAEVARLIERYRTYQNANHDQLTCCYAGVLDTVRRLSDRGHPLAVVTSKTNGLAKRSIAHVGLAPYFRVIVGVESTARHKPDPDPVRFALEQLDASTDGAFFVGDSPHDIAAGNAAGVSTVAALWGAFTRDALEQARPRYLIDRIEGLDALLRGAARNRPRNDRVDRRCRPPAAAHARRQADYLTFGPFKRSTRSGYLIP